MGRIFKHFSFVDRMKIEKMVKEKYSVARMAETLRVHNTSIYREMKRGAWYKTNPKNFKEELSYSADLAEERYRNNLAAKGVMIKLGNDFEYANYIEKKIAEEHYSPAAVLGEIEREGLQFTTKVCFKTIYNYIDKGVFASITNETLPERAKRKKRYRKVRPNINKRLLGESIEKRPEDIKNRNEFGHWEMDTVKGKRTSKRSLLVLTERKTRKEIIIKLPLHSAESVVRALDQIEKEFQDKFPKIFKTITCDNGSEFSYSDRIIKSSLNNQKDRTKLYYCHPYTSWERGSNEVANKLIRRWIPKGTDFDNMSEMRVKEIEEWMNHYPRKIYEYRSSEELYLEELKLLE